MLEDDHVAVFTSIIVLELAESEKMTKLKVGLSPSKKN